MPQLSGPDYAKSWAGLLKIGEFVSVQYDIYNRHLPYLYLKNSSQNQCYCRRKKDIPKEEYTQIVVFVKLETLFTS
jgi:hypothetical protein